MNAQLAVGWPEMFDSKLTSTGSTLSYVLMAQLLAQEAGTILNVGCGRGGAVDLSQARPLGDYRGDGRTVVGIDVDEAGELNPVVDEFKLIGADGLWPVEDDSIDLAISDWTLEHVLDPTLFVDELHRTLRPGGALIARTVSRYSPLSVAARAVPNRRHADTLRMLRHDRQPRDVFPTAYLMNSERALARLFGDRFEWTALHGIGFQQYFLAWPRLARFIAMIEPRLPQAWQTTLVVYARKR